MSAPGPVRIALIGTHGFGRVHLDRLARLRKQGSAELVGVVDLAEPPPEVATLHHRSLEDLLAALAPERRPEVVIVATPIDTHVPLALEALAAGCDVYLEKPPVPALADHTTLLEAARSAQRSIQVGFQARGGAGVEQMRDLVAAGTLGRIDTVRVHGAWTRDRAYYQRSAWAGKRRLNGRRVADGVATNPLAHGVHAGLVIAGIAEVSDIARVTTELRRAHDIEADDTTFLRIEPVPPAEVGAPRRPRVVCALTTTSPTQHDPWVEIIGDSGSQRLFYTLDRAERTTFAAGAEGEDEVTEVTFGRVDLVDNLLAHVRDRSVELISPLASTGAFTTVLEAIQSVPDPLPIAGEHIDWAGEDLAAHPVVHGIEDALLTALDEERPFSEIPVPWAREDAVSTWSPPI